MKKITIFLALLFVSVALYAEKITLQTGDFFGISNTDYFYPKDIAFTGSRLTITSVKKEEDNLWCLKLAAPKSTNTNAPIIFEYYVKKGDILTMRRLANPMEEITIKVVSVNWNEITIEY